MTKKLITWGLLLVLGAGGAGYLILINPDNPLTRHFQRPITAVDARIVIGPYPVERDLQRLAEAHVGLVVSLLDPAIPYEKTLLRREEVLAAKYGLRLKNFPMTSILGRKFGGHYATSAADAAAAIAGTSDKVYLHCYLGLHRIQAVRELLANRGLATERYALREAERDRSRRLLDAADAAFREGRYDEALAQLDQIKAEEVSENARFLRAWSEYRLGRYDSAAREFAALRQLSPARAAAATGAGYCALRQERLEAADEAFASALQQAPDDADALGGLGLLQHRRGRDDEAARLLRRALAVAPDNQEFRDLLTQLERR